jgi:hypothetical protein
MESAETAELNARRVRFGAEMAARGQENEARGFEAESLLRGFEKKATRRLGYVQAGSTLLTGALRAYGASGGGSSGTGRTESAYQAQRAGERQSY